MAVTQSAGLGNFRAVPTPDRMPQQTSAELIQLSDMAKVVRQVADDIDPDLDEQDDGKKPSYLRGEFNANLAEKITEFQRNQIASDLLRGIEADKESRKDWEAMVERAIRFMGIIYEEASGEATSEGSISKAWHTLILESSIGFWANAYGEFLPADGPVKVRDDLSANDPGPGHNGGPPLGDGGVAPTTPAPLTRTQLAEAFERFWNHYLTAVDKQYYRDFSRMLFSLGPKGTEFRKVYYNPLRRMVVSEWVKSENLIVSNDAADLSTAGRITERIMMRHADVKRMQWKGHWLDAPLTQPVDQPTRIEETIGRSEGIQPRIQIPADQLHTIYECCCELDLPEFEHEEDGEITGLPLPYRVTLDKDSRQILEIRRHWKEDDEDFNARQRYVMFGLLPGFGLYYLGYVHVLGNTERALTAMEREVIDNTMMAVFPAWFAAKGAFSRGQTQVHVSPMGVVEVDLQMQKSVDDILKSIQPPTIGPAHMALFEKIEANGKAVSGKFDVPVGEGTANIPVGTMIAMIENGTKMMMAVHKGLHASRAEEFSLMRELMAEDPDLLKRYSKDEIDWENLTEELEDLDLVPSSDPNTPSHVHRVMRFVGLGQLTQMFPEQADRQAIFQEGMSILQVGDPQRFTNKNPLAQPPDPKMLAEQNRMQIAAMNDQSKARDSALRFQTAAQQNASKEKVAQIDAETEALKTHAELIGDQARQHDSAAEAALDAQTQHAHDVSMQQRDHVHEATQNHLDRHTPSPDQPSFSGGPRKF